MAIHKSREKTGRSKMAKVHIDPRDLSGLSVEQAGAWTLALSACLERGSIPDAELRVVCRTADEAVLDLVRSRLVVLGANGSTMLTHAETLSRRSKRSLIENARANTDMERAGAGAGAQARRLVGGRVEDASKDEEATTTSSSELESLLEQMISRMRSALDDDGMFYVLRVMDMLSRSKRGGLLQLSTRIEMWEKASKVPPEQFAHACYLFAVNGPMSTGKNFPYLMGIVNKSARSWYIEERAKHIKEAGFKLEGEE